MTLLLQVNYSIFLLIFKKGGEGLSPVLVLTGSTKCLVNFGKTAFIHPQEGFLQLHINLTEKEIMGLYKLFLRYKSI